ncbi:DNA methyltransferase [Gordonia sp. (in: high G+C Gram-positive bacteria)]|uniref:DNA methyltransferase n=1 Tax=Gordonia sp. (in: high G+C Gram-positive bacteria) TaxID=84139 RepID=UPI003C785DD3
MARSRKPVGPTPVESIGHQETRSNIPTADAQEFYDDASENVEPVRYPRDPALDPQLVWRGKDRQDSEDLVVDAPPIFIQEKIDPRVLVENLRRTAARPEDEPELSLFDDFDGLDELSQVEFYEHQANWSNRMILGDSLQAMASLAERESLRGKVQMVYIDPPYGIKFNSNWQVSARKRDVKDGKLEHAAREAEQIKAFRDTWEDGIHSYLSYLRDRLVAARDLLANSGSCFVQIGDENVHIVRSLLDEVFGPENFVAQITVQKAASSGESALGRVADFILWYARDIDRLKYRPLFDMKPDDDLQTYRRIRMSDGTDRPSKPFERTPDADLPIGARLYRPDPMTSDRAPGDGDLLEYQFDGRICRPGKGTFKTNKSGLDVLARAQRLWVTSGGLLQFIRYPADFPATAIQNVWTGTRGGAGKDRIYVVQTAARVGRCHSVVATSQAMRGCG